MLYILQVLIVALAIAYVSAAPGAVVAPVSPTVVTATSSQFISRNYNGFSAPLVATAPFAVASAVAAPLKVAPFVAAAPYRYAPYFAAPAIAAPLKIAAPLVPAPAVAAPLKVSAPAVAAPLKLAPYVASPTVGVAAPLKVASYFAAPLRVAAPVNSAALIADSPYTAAFTSPYYAGSSFVYV